MFAIDWDEVRPRLFAFRLRKAAAPVYSEPDRRASAGYSLTWPYEASFETDNILEVIIDRRWRLFGEPRPLWVKVRIVANKEWSIGAVGYLHATDLLPSGGYLWLRARFPHLPQRKDWPQ